jgi:hypothetical protein
MNKKPTPKKELKVAIEYSLTEVVRKSSLEKPNKGVRKSIEKFSKKLSKQLSQLLKKETKKMAKASGKDMQQLKKSAAA